MAYVVTGSAGFIGFHTSLSLLKRGDVVVGIDCINDYYDISLKQARLKILQEYSNFHFYRIDISDENKLKEVFNKCNPEIIVHLAAQAGVRYSIDNPSSYVQSNLVGFANILECARAYKVKHLVYASTSSVYGSNELLPFSEDQGVSHPVSFYAATKRANELMAHSYAHLYNIPCTGLRFFTVYGPWGRPDMALFKFTKAIIEGSPIDVYNNGDMRRDFTFIDDIVSGILSISSRSPVRESIKLDSVSPHPGKSAIAPFAIYNIGNGNPVQLMDFVRSIEENIGLKAKLNMMPMQKGDVSQTAADTTAFQSASLVSPTTSVSEGVKLFVEWYLEYYQQGI